MGVAAEAPASERGQGAIDRLAIGRGVRGFAEFGWEGALTSDAMAERGIPEGGYRQVAKGTDGTYTPPLLAPSSSLV